MDTVRKSITFPSTVNKLVREHQADMLVRLNTDVTFTQALLDIIAQWRDTHESTLKVK